MSNAEKLFAVCPGSEPGHLVAGERAGHLVTRLESGGAQHQVHHLVEQPDQRLERGDDERQRRPEPHRGPVRAGQGGVLGYQLADHHVQRRH